MVNINQRFLVEFKDYISENYKEDCKYGYGWLLERDPFIEKSWEEKKITEKEYLESKTNYETLIYLINTELQVQETSNGCC